MSVMEVSSRTAVPDRSIWLAKAHVLLRPYFSGQGLRVPQPVVVTVGALPEGVRGQCTLASGKMPVITVSERLSQSVTVLGVLVHEMVHASLPPWEEHGPAFRAWATQLGLTGPPTSTHPGMRLQLRLRSLGDRLGPYPGRGDAVVFTRLGEVLA